MNTVPIIRKGSIKDYCSNGFGGGMVIGIMVFLAALINNSIITSLLHGLFAWIAIFILFIGIGFTSEEYYKRKKRIRELNSVKYSFLDDHHFILHQDLFFEGVYKGFWFRVIPMTKWQKKGKELKYDVIESFYNLISHFRTPRRSLEYS